MNIVKGSLIVGKSGVRLEVVDLVNRQPIVNTANGLKAVSKAAIVSVTHPSPRNAVSIAGGRVNVDLDRLSLDFQPLTSIPQWKPTATVKPYESLSKLYIDIETTGLNPSVDRVLMVGLLLDGETTIITDPNGRS